MQQASGPLHFTNPLLSFDFPLSYLSFSFSIFFSHIKTLALGSPVSVVLPRDWKIGKYRRYFEEISDIGRHRNDNRHRLSIHRNIAKKWEKSPIYQWNIGEAPINRRKIASGSDARSNRRYFYRFFGKFPDISYQSSPRSCVFQPGSKIMDLGFVKFKSNGTTAKRPLKQIQKTQGAKEKQFFFVFFGSFEWIFSEIKRGWIFPEIEWGMDFLGNQTGLQKIIIITWLD